MNYLDPLLPLSLAFAIACLFWVWRSSRPRYWLLAVALANLLIISSGPLSSFFARPLERRYDSRPFVDTGEAIVILGGGCNGADQYRPFTELAADSYRRTLAGAVVYRSKAPRPVLVTGFGCANAMAHLLVSEGVPQNLILLEDRATNTHENAIYSANILRANHVGTVVLVTDAKSMLRAELAFRKQGVAVLPYPVGLGSFEFSVFDLLPSWQALRNNADSVHEYLGLLRYRWSGWI
jgi:uncharacterized SAM-binding protein YcdF (DUF218 family)